MPTLVIKSLPDELHQRLKRTAAAHRRSLTQETMHLLEKALDAEETATCPAARQGPSYWGRRPLVDFLRQRPLLRGLRRRPGFDCSDLRRP